MTTIRSLVLASPRPCTASPRSRRASTWSKADRQTSGFMRAPVEMPYMYALESAMDELAVALKMDPIELRRVNDIRESPIDGARFTSRSLMKMLVTRRQRVLVGASVIPSPDRCAMVTG